MTMRSEVLLYLSGPITATATHSVEQNVAEALAVYLDCIRRGIPAVCVHLGAAFPSAHGIDYETWMAYDFAMLDRCTHLLMMPRWETSKGARLELSHWVETRGNGGVVDSVSELCEMVGIER